MSKTVVLLLAGGVGSRLWPLSNQSCPKQFLKIDNNLSMLQQTALRFLSFFEADQIFTITSSSFLDLTRKHLSYVHPRLADQIILEPYSKNTAFAVTWALKILNDYFHPSLFNLLISPIDHVFFPEEGFVSTIQKAIASFDPSHILAFGIKPFIVSTQLGYLEKGAQLNTSLYVCTHFVEKPDLQLSLSLIKKHALWNVGLYLISNTTLESELKAFLPNFSKILHKDVKKIDPLLPSLSIDHGLMQKTKKIYVHEFQNVRWLDLGSWESLSLYYKEYALAKLPS